MQTEDNIARDYRQKLKAKAAASKINTETGKTKAADISKVEHKRSTKNNKAIKSKQPAGVVNFMDYMMNIMVEIRKEMLLFPERCAEVTNSVPYIFAI